MNYQKYHEKLAGNVGVLKRVPLEKFTFAGQKYVDQSPYYDLKMGDSELVFFRNHVDDLVIELKSEIYGLERDRKTETVSYPSTWWDAFKKRFFPEWLKKYFPVSYTEYTVRMTQCELYPQVLPADKHGNAIVHVFVENEVKNGNTM